MRRHAAPLALARYGLAVLAVAATVALALWLRPVALEAGQLSLVAILTVGWMCGLRPALIAWGLATLAFAYFFTSPLDSLAVDRVNLPRLIIFALLGLLMATVSAARRRAHDSLRRIHAELEARVRERTTDLERSNEQLQAALAERQGHVWLLESIDRIDRVMQTTNDLEQMMSDVLDAALSFFDCDRAWLMHPCDPEAVSHEVKMQRTRPEFPSLLGVGDEVPIDPETADMFRTVRASSGPVQFGPHSAHPLSSELAQRRDVLSRIVMALYPKGERPYIFGASQCSYARLWTPREEFLFQEIGRRLEDALTSLSISHRLRESEKRYRHIFESTGVSIWEEDFSQVKAAVDDFRSRGVRDFRAYFAAHPHFVQEAIAMVKVSDVNDATVKLFGATSKDELLTSLDRVFLPETEEVFTGELIAFAEGRTYFESETVLQTLSGNRLTVLLTITFPPPRGRPDRVLVTITDISERRRAEEALQKAQAELAHVTRVTTLGELAASIAHEVNQPLAAIVADANASLNWLAAANPDLDQVRDAMAAIVKDGYRAADVVQRIRQLATKTEPRKARLDVNDVVRDVLSIVRSELRHHEVTLAVDLASGLPPVLGDRVQLQQVVLNLVMNGIEAMADVGNRPRELLIRSEQKEPGTILIAVRDSGSGVDPHGANRIFDAFYTTKPYGLGMGLSISRSIVEAHGGLLWATPNEPHGAVLHLSLPVGPSPLPADVAPDSRRSAS